MYRLQSMVLCWCMCYAIANTASVTSFIKRCKVNDAACIKASAIDAYPHIVAGIPEIGLPPADPITLDDVRADDVNLKFGFRNMKVTGIKNCKVLDFVRDLDKSTMKLVLECPLRATGQYDLDGKLVLFNAVGNGDFVVKSDKVILEVTVNVKNVDREGEKYFKITGFDYKYDIIDKATIILENLFDGDEKRAKPIKEIIEKSSTELIAGVGKPIIEGLITKEVENVQIFLNKVSTSNLELS